MQAGGRVAQQHVARDDRVTVERAIFLHHADDGAGQIVRPRLVQAGHLRRLTAGQRHVVGPAPPGDALHDPRDLLHPEPGAGDVVHERDRRGAVHQDVVDAVIDQVLADGIEAFRL